MMSPTKLSIPCVSFDKDRHETNDNITFEISLLGMEIYIRDRHLTIQLPLIDAQNVVDAMKILIDSTYEEEEEIEYDDRELGKDEEFFPREPTKKNTMPQ